MSVGDPLTQNVLARCTKFPKKCRNTDEVVELQYAVVARQYHCRGFLWTPSNKQLPDGR